MSFPHRESTYVRLAPVEAYAALHRRTMTITGSDVVLSLHSAHRRHTPDALRSLREGDQIVAQDLETIVPGIFRARWEFGEFDKDDEYRLWTDTDDVVMTLSIKQTQIESPLLGEGRLRGTAARLVVSIEYG